MIYLIIQARPFFLLRPLTFFPLLRPSHPFPRPIREEGWVCSTDCLSGSGLKPQRNLCGTHMENSPNLTFSLFQCEPIAHDVNWRVKSLLITKMFSDVSRGSHALQQFSSRSSAPLCCSGRRGRSQGRRIRELCVRKQVLIHSRMNTILLTFLSIPSNTSATVIRLWLPIKFYIPLSLCIWILKEAWTFEIQI